LLTRPRVTPSTHRAGQHGEGGRLSGESQTLSSSTDDPKYDEDRIGNPTTPPATPKTRCSMPPPLMTPVIHLPLDFSISDNKSLDARLEAMHAPDGAHAPTASLTVLVGSSRAQRPKAARQLFT
jgi:hypothetical protein